MKKLDKFKECFPKSFINKNNEMIVDPVKNIFFQMEGVENEQDLAIKLLSWVSRAAYKEAEQTEKNRKKKISMKTFKRENYFLDGINKFLHTSFGWEDMRIIYTKFGNGLNQDELLQFMENDYDMRFFLLDIGGKMNNRHKDYSSTKGVVCPYCGFVDENDYHYEHDQDSEILTVCLNCDKDFYYSWAITEIIFKSYKNEK